MIALREELVRGMDTVRGLNQLVLQFCPRWILLALEEQLIKQCYVAMRVKIAMGPMCVSKTLIAHLEGLVQLWVNVKELNLLAGHL